MDCSRGNFKKMKLFVLTAVLVIFNSCFALGQPDNRVVLEREIAVSIKSGNYCNTAQDCRLVYFDCPFGCGSYVNKDFNPQPTQDKVKDYIKKFGGCDYDCVRPCEPECVNNKCVEATCQTGREYLNFECKCPENTEQESHFDEAKGQRIYKCVPVS